VAFGSIRFGDPRRQLVKGLSLYAVDRLVFGDRSDLYVETMDVAVRAGPMCRRSGAQPGPKRESKGAISYRLADVLPSAPGTTGTPGAFAAPGMEVDAGWGTVGS